jgi:capsular polysaccharide export protein
MGEFKRALRNAIGKKPFMKFAILYNKMKPKRKTKKPVALLIGFSEWKNDYIQTYLKDYDLKFIKDYENLDVVVNESEKYKEKVFMVWGYKNSPKLESFAKRKKIPFFRIEDGFIRSIQLGASKSTPISLCIDSQALYYDATRPSDLEDLLNTYDFQSNPELVTRAKNAIQTLKDLNISKYNNVGSKDIEVIYGEKTKERILVIGQVEDDESIKRGCNKPMTNNDLVWLARSENPHADIIYKPHPDVLFGKRPMQSNPNDVKHISKVITEPLSITDAFQTIDRVYTITSLSGFEALLRGIPVTTIGAPFYSGWGLTDDRQKVPRRKRKLTIEEVFAAAYILYPKYMHPFTKEAISIEDAILTLKEMKDIEENANVETGKIALLVGFNEVTRKYMAIFLKDYQKIEIIHSLEQLSDAIDNYSDITVYLLNSEDNKGYLKFVKENNIKSYFVNPGLISMGVLPIPFSLCIDKKGDNKEFSSDLINLLNTYDFKKDPELLLRANRVHSTLIEKGINGITYSPSMNYDMSIPNKKKVLVLGERSSESQQFEISNEELMWIAKTENPDAEIIFKPHPADENVENYSYANLDHVAKIIKGPINLSDLLGNVSQVYTIRSTGGFEALLKGIKVTTLGTPFYAGWGLTDDRKKQKNRNRKLNTVEILAAAYILYPKYFNPFTLEPSTIEQALELFEIVVSTESRRDPSTQIVLKNREQNLNKFESFEKKIDNTIIPNEKNGQIGVLSKGIQTIPNLQSFLRGDVIFNPTENDDLAYVAGWGMKPSAKKALDFSKKNGIPYLGLEDGFLRSVGLGVEGSPPLSICVDNIGIYYDATKPSRLENILNSDGWKQESLLNNAKRAISLIKENYLSKYNHAPMVNPSIFSDTAKERVLIVDQTLGDMSITLGLADKARFKEMYEMAKRENPNAKLYIKTHPDVISGKKEGNLTPKDVDATFIYDDCNPLSLVEKVDKVYVVTSQLGFEALMLGKEVHCFGMPFYAGWGVTKDQITIERRKKKRSVEELFAAAYLLYPRYINPNTGLPGTIFDVINYLIQHRNNNI